MKMELECQELAYLSFNGILSLLQDGQVKLAMFKPQIRNILIAQ